MMRRQRALHARLWILLALLIAGLFAAALTARARVQSHTGDIGQAAD